MENQTAKRYIIYREFRTQRQIVSYDLSTTSHPLITIYAFICYTCTSNVIYMKVMHHYLSEYSRITNVKEINGKHN